MKPMAYNRYKYSGELYKFVRKTVGSDSTLNYYFSENISLSAGLDQNNRMTIKCDQPLLIGSVIANIKDSNGDLILDDSNWQITNLQPILNAFSVVDGYTMKAVKFQGTV